MFLRINPRYRELLRRVGLVGVDDFLDLPAEILCGHTDRNVGRVMLASGFPAILKREHRVPWRDRLVNFLAGFGWVSKSRREADTLALLERSGVGCPEWLAVGEDDHGRAFLLLRDLGSARELRHVAAEERSSWRRLRLAWQLGRALARLHQTGFRHGDLYVKHVLVAPDQQRIWFLDWQRAGRGNRFLDMASLDATLPEDLVSVRERLTCLRAYLGGKTGTDAAVRQIRRLTQRLLRRRHVRTERDGQLPVGTQSVLRLDGEALCIRPAFWSELGGAVPPWLKLPRHLDRRLPATQTIPVALPNGRAGVLVRRRARHWAAWLLGRPRVADEIRTAGLLFRRERRGEEAPRVLAFGQRHFAGGWTESFLLTEPAADARRRDG